jgi:hypothetical protein
MKRRQANKIGNMWGRGVKLAWKPRTKWQAACVILRSMRRAVRTWVLCGAPEVDRKKG